MCSGNIPDNRTIFTVLSVSDRRSHHILKDPIEKIDIRGTLMF